MYIVPNLRQPLCHDFAVHCVVFGDKHRQLLRSRRPRIRYLWFERDPTRDTWSRRAYRLLAILRHFDGPDRHLLILNEGLTGNVFLSLTLDLCD
jgi:hypothetical protein